MASSKINENKNEYVTKVIVEYFPSRVELYNFLNVFLDKHGYPHDQKMDNKDSVATFSFFNSVKIY